MPSLPPLEMDHNEYADDVQAFDLTEKEAKEFLEVLWLIAMTAVDLELGLDSAQAVVGGFLKKLEEESTHQVKMKDAFRKSANEPLCTREKED